jgi:myo-inositol 2-dehydrogenase/D-chiro-inositol 1-dehydrogenase
MKLAVIGCGKQGIRHLAALAAMADVTGLVVADIDPARGRAAAERFGAEFRVSAQAVFTDGDIDAVVIAAPTGVHLPLARRAVAARKHFFCEKPFGADAAIAREIAQEAARQGIVGRVGYLYRFAPAIAAARDTVRSHLLGRVDMAVFAIAATGGQAAWKHRRCSQGGAANELASHMIDLALWCFGPLCDSAVTARNVVRPHRTIGGVTGTADAPDRIAARLTSRSGVAITIEGDFAAPGFSQWLMIRGENGFVRASINPEFASHCHLDEARGGLSAGKYPLPDGAESNLYRLQAQEFIAAIAGNVTTDAQACDLAEAAQVCEWLETLALAPITAYA